MCTVVLPPGVNPIAVKYIMSCIISYHIISYHIISYHIISYHIISYHIISYHIISYHISYHIISYHIISYHIYIISYHIVSYHIISIKGISVKMTDEEAKLSHSISEGLLTILNTLDKVNLNFIFESWLCRRRFRVICRLLLQV